jgi:sugar-phosphatase
VEFAVSAILFDLDGVLVDSTETIRRHWIAFAAERGLDPNRVTQWVHGRRTIDCIRTLTPHLDASSATADFEQLEVDDVEGVRLLPGAIELVTGLARRWAVVTSGSQAIARARLRHCGLPIPDVLISADDVAEGKPAPEGYLAAAAEVGAIPRDCLVIEDAPAGVRAGKSAGATVLGLLSSHSADDLCEADGLTANLASCHLVAAAPGPPVRLVVEPSTS